MRSPRAWPAARGWSWPAARITVTGGRCWFMGAEADSEDDLRRMVRTHHKRGVDGIRRAVEAGVTTIEHCSWVTETNERNYTESLAAQIAEQGIFVCPTINVNAPYVAELTGIAVGEHLQAIRRPH